MREIGIDVPTLAELMHGSTATLHDRFNYRRPFTMPEVLVIAELLAVKVSSLIAEAEERGAAHAEVGQS